MLKFINIFYIHTYLALQMRLHRDLNVSAVKLVACLTLILFLMFQKTSFLPKGCITFLCPYL